MRALRVNNKRVMESFRIVRELKPADFKDSEVWSEYYDFEELEELKSWGVEDQYINQLLEIAKEGASHPYYTVPKTEALPDRMQIFVSCKFTSNTGREFEGVIINPDPFVIGIFCNDEIQMFNPNLMDFWKKSEEIVRSTHDVGDEPIFPLRFSTSYKDSEGNTVKGTYGEFNA